MRHSLLAVLCVFSLILSSDAFAADPVAALVNGTNSTALHGTISGKAKIQANSDAPDKSVLKFVGEGHVAVEGKGGGLDFDKSFTIEFDVQFSTLAGDPYLISKRSPKAGDVTSGYWIEFGEGRWIQFTAAEGAARAAFIPVVGQTYRVVCVHRSLDEGKGENLIYIDGVQAGAASSKSIASANDSPLTLGDFAGGYHAFNGTLSGVQLSATEWKPQNGRADVPPLKEDVIGERDTLLGLVAEVQRNFQTRKLSSENTDRALVDIQRSLLSPELTLRKIESARTHLGEIVGRTAESQFPKREFAVWQQSRWADVSPHAWPDQNAKSPTSISISMPRDAFGSQALVVANLRGVASNIKIEMKATSGAPRVRFRRAWQIACPDLRYRPDPLALIPDNQLVLQPGESSLLWIEADSHGTAPGKYVLPIRLSSAGTDVNVQLEIAVAKARMPKVLDSNLCNFPYLEKMGWITEYQQAALEDLDAHYINTHICDISAVAKADPEGNLIGPVDFSAVDRGLAIYQKHSKQIGFFWGGDPHHKLPFFPELEFLSEPWKKAVVAWYGQLLKHLDELGLGRDQIFMYVYDECSSPQVQEIYAMLKEAAPDVRLFLNPTTGFKPEELRQIAPYVDIWMPSYESLVSSHPDDFAFLKSTGKPVWTYSCVNGTSLPAYDYNLRRHWVAWNLRIEGVAQWAYADRGGWKGTNSWQFVSGAFATVYAKPNAPESLKLTETLTPSRRWEAWRIGAQDYQLLKMAKQASSRSATVEAELKKAVSMVVDSPNDLDAADLARVILLKIIDEHTESKN
jgi:hypothetical protein